MKTTKKLLAFMLSALMIFSVAFVPGADLSMFAVEADAAITLGGITQQRIVSNYESLYASYQARFFTGTNSNSPTNFVIPGLSQSDYYTPQGMTYWEEKEWILISAYDAKGSGRHSVIYAIDAKTTEFVALFKILNANGTVNTSHGGGIAASKYNFYYADTGSNISYFPLSEMDVAKGTVKEIKLRGSINCGGELGGAATSYCCYEDGVLWAGNFYYSEDNRYNTKAHSTSDSMIVGYELHGNSSDEEWYYLSKGFNYVNLNNSTSEQTWNNGAGSTMKYTTSYTGGKIMISGSITTSATSSAPLGEITANFASFKLTEGKKYTIEFTTNNRLTDMYMFAPTGQHANVKQSSQTTITDLGDGYYHYSMTFTAGLKPNGADSSWPTTQSTNGSFTGTYTIRFDQDSITGNRDFLIKDFAIMDYDSTGFDADPLFEGRGCAGNPTHIITFPGMDKFQYAMVYKGRVYISRSWKRTSGTNHTRELMVGNLDTSSTGTNYLVINGRTRPCYKLELSNMTRFGGDNGMDTLNQMLYMGEALCVMNDNLYMFGEGAAWAYNGAESNNKCPEPIDVIWKIDQHALLGEERSREDVSLSHYEKVWSFDELDNDDEYIIVYESELTDPVTQKNIIYALDAFGGYGSKKLPKQDSASQENSGDSLGIIGYKITSYNKSFDGEELYLEDEDDANRSIRWKINASGIANSEATMRISNTDMYYAKYKHLYFGSRLISMRTDNGTNLNKIKASTPGDGIFYLYYNGETAYYLWCNDGSNQSYIDAYTNYYSTHGKVGYTPVYHGLEEKAGTFHADGFYSKVDEHSGNIMHEAVNAKYGQFHIYKRVADVYADTYESRVYTDLDAKLQADGTYTINLETYAIGTTQYKVLEQQRPTDFIFVLDTSGSMTGKDARGYHTELSNWDPLKMKQAAGDKSDSWFSDGDHYNEAHKSNFYYKFPDGEFGSIYVAFNKKDESYSRDIWLWAEHPITGRCYRLSKFGFMTHGSFSGGANWDQDSSYRITEANFLANQQNLGWANQAAVIADVKADKNRTDYHSKRNSTSKRADYDVMNYTYTDDYGYTRASYYSYGECTRLEGMQQAVEKLTYKITTEASRTGLNHRLAIVQYGSNSSGSWTNMGMYTNSSTSRVAYTGAGTVSNDNYRKAFYSTSQFGTVRTIINNLSASGDTFVDYGMDMAYNIIDQAKYADGTSYLADGNRSACIIMITDGCPGFGGSDFTTANTVANAAIQNAYKAKDAGAYVYTVQMGNNTMSGFDMDTYMDNLSSEFISAQSMTDSGDRNVKEINYRLDVPTGSSFNLDTLVKNVFNSVTSNSRNALMKLDASSLLHAEITDAFDLSKATASVKFAPAAYDGLDRLYFEDKVAATGVTASYNKNAQTIDVSGYDYSVNHVSKSNVDKGLANKLVVTFEGVVPNVDEVLNNTNINNTNTTAIYQKANGMEFKKFPTETFTVPEYTYILDYGVNMYDSDINGTLLSVDSLPRKQDTYKQALDNENMGIAFTNEAKDMIYSLKSSSDGSIEESRGYCLIQRDDGTYDWFRLNILPATNIYFEETGATATEFDGAAKWQPTATPRPFYQQLTSDDDVYGHDNAYIDDGTNHSSGSAYVSSVTSTQTRSETLSFSYTGNAFDIYGSCGNETGIYIITVRKADKTIEKVYILDTYFSDSAYYSDSSKINQVPILHHENPGSDTYTVEVTSAFLATIINSRPASTFSLRDRNEDVSFYTTDISEEAKEAILSFADMDYLLEEDIEVIFCDENSIFNGGTGVDVDAGMSSFALDTSGSGTVSGLKNYFDGYRVYNSYNYDEYVNSEKGAQYENVIDSVISAESITSGSALAGVAYLENGSTPENGVNFSNYEQFGPTNELYLKSNEGSIAFNVQLLNSETKVMVSLRAVNKPTTAMINGKEYEISTSNEMYYDISHLLTPDSNGIATFEISNIGEGLLAIDNIKLTNCAIAAMTMAYLPRLRMLAAAEEPVLPEEIPAEDTSWPVVTPGSNENETENDDTASDNTTADNNSESESIIDTLKAMLNKIREFFNKIINLLKTFAE